MAQTLEQKRAWYRANKDKCRAWVRATAKTYKEKHPDRIKASKKKYNSAHKDKLAAQMRSWRSRNPDNWRRIAAESKHRRRARKLQNGLSDCTKKIALLQLERFCHWCCTQLSKMNLTIDHVIPLKRGGAHVPYNLVACCKSCNSSKNDKLVHEWTWRII